MTEAISTTTPTPQDTYIDSLGYTLEAWLAMTDDQQRAICEQKLAGKTDEEQDEFFRAVGSEVNELQESLEDVYDNFEDLIDEMPVDQQATAQALLEQLQQLIESCDTVQPEVRDFMGIHNDHNIDVGASGTTIEGDDLEFNGGEYIYTNDGSASVYDDPFEADMTDEEYLREEGIINEYGEVIRNVDNDTSRLDYDDIEEALAGRNAAREAGAPITLNFGDRQVELVSADITTGEYVLKVSNEDGSFCYIRLVTGGSRIRLTLNGTISDEQAQLIRDTYPTEFLQQLYMPGSSESVYDTLHPEDTQAIRNAAVRGYHNITESAPSSLASYTGGLPAGLRDEYDEAVERIFTAYDRGDDPETVMQEIFDSWSDLSAEDKAALTRNLICAFFRYNKNLFESFFRPVIPTLENMMANGQEEFSRLSLNNQIAILILETQLGAGNYGGSTILTDGYWHLAGETENAPYASADALAELQEIVMAAVGNLTGIGPALTLRREFEEGVENGQAQVHDNGNGTETSVQA